VSSATLLDFAAANDAAAATTKKLLKQAALSAYFRGLDEQDLRLAVRYAAGRAFAATDGRVLNVGGAIVGEVVLALLKLDRSALRDVYLRHGELGNALTDVWPAAGLGTPDAPLRLAELAVAFDELAATGNRERKSETLTALFSRCSTGREATYLSKIIFGDLRTGVQEGVLQASIAQAFEKTLAAVQRCQLLVGDLDEVAVLAKNDGLHVATFRLFHPLQFMLASPQETPEDAAATLDGRAFYAEDKLDGIRAQVHKSGGTGEAARVAIYTRTMDRADASFPDVVKAVAQVPGDFLLDGELVPWRDGQVMPFAHIQKRLGRKVLTPKMLRDNPVVFVAFDILYRDGRLLMDCPLKVRREALHTLSNPEGLPPSPLAGEGGGEGEARGVEPRSYENQRLTFTPHPDPLPQGERGPEAPLLLNTRVTEVTTAEQIAEAFAAARARRNEGVMLKDPESLYSPGRRGKWWLKLKTYLPTLDCVVTAAERGHGKRRDWLSDYTFAVWDDEPGSPDAKLVNVGKAYSGVTDEEIKRLTELFHSLTLERHGGYHVVTPKVVLEVAFDQIQKSARHASGFALRFPRIKRIRWDKSIQDADRLARVAEIYALHANTARALHPPEPEPAPPPEPTLFDGLV
jgi:DNA ligase 1